MKIFLKIILIGVGLIAVLLLITFLYHTYQLRNEANKYPAPGKLVEIDNSKVHVYSEGDGDLTLVFMAGSGTSSPTIDFKPLWMKLKDDYRIVVVEKSGYGWSETSSNPRDIDTMLQETRKAIELSGEGEPYVLVPHSMSGLEAIYWARKYPEEIKAIVGLDPAIPDVYLNSSFKLPSKSQLYAMYFISRIGISRFMGEEGLENNIPLLKSDVLSEEDKNQLIAMFYKSTFTKNMLNEANYVKDNAKKVKKSGIPSNTPMYFFIAEGSNNSVIPNWDEILSAYLSNVDNSKYKLLDSEHYIHHEYSDFIAQEIDIFLKEIDNN